LPDHAVGYAERAALLAAIAKLPKRQRAVLALRYYEDRSDAEIAELISCRPSSVRGYASRAFATLRIELRSEDPETPKVSARIQGDG
jgi:RNA polymerase sigma factor (sigma-70 family)